MTGTVAVNLLAYFVGLEKEHFVGLTVYLNAMVFFADFKPQKRTT